MAPTEFQSLKVLHIITGLQNGGAEGALFRLVTAPSHHTHHVVSMMDSGVHGESLVRAGIAVHLLKMPRGRVTFSGMRSLVRILRRVRPDVVQTWMYHADLLGGMVARLAGYRTVVWGVRASDAHHHGGAVLPALLVRAGAWVSRIIPTRIVFASYSGARIHQAAGYADDRSIVIPNGFDVSVLAPDPDARRRTRAVLGWSDGVFIGTVARWDSLKDHANLAVALAALTSHDTNWTAVWIGPGMSYDNEDLMALLDRVGVRHRVVLLGPSADVPGVMNAIDLHVLSSRSEAFPNVVAEAMACGTPCVTTDVGDAGWIVGETGWVVPPQQPGLLARALASALKECADAPVWDARRQSSRRRAVEMFSLHSMVEHYSRTWQQAIDATRPNAVSADRGGLRKKHD